MIAIRFCLVFLVFLSAAFANGSDEPRCQTPQFSIDTHFDGGALDTCETNPDGSFDITLRAEDQEVIIQQPWFAFRVRADAENELKIRLRVPDAYVRYWPKLSTDGETWKRAPADAVQISESAKIMTMNIDVKAGTTWIAAQELLTGEWYRQWLGELESHRELTSIVIAESIERRPIHLVKTADRAEVVILLGRQHPAEVPGALAMRDFVDALMADTELARQFRQRYSLLILPLLNPDGVANGHWRHNAAETDLNRDWGIFTQAETLAVERLLQGLEKRGTQPRLMLDFHATKFTDTAMFYTQAAGEKTDPPRFDINWFANVRARLPGFDFKHDPRPSCINPNTKGYFYRNYGIPAFTYEIADEADRDTLHATTPVFAEEMMRELLRAK